MHKKRYTTIIMLLTFSLAAFSLSPYVNVNSQENAKEDITIKTVLFDFISSQYKVAVGKEMSQDRLHLLVSSIMEASKFFEISPLMIAAIIDTETNFKNIIGSYGEVGYMQLRPSTAQFVVNKYSELFESLNYTETSLDWIEDRLLVDPRYNILVGTAYLKYLMETHGDPYKAIGWYNGGGNIYYANKVVYKINRIAIRYPII
ncbi:MULTISPECIES: transglycosylase SLT domain-containing protein [Petrotoga]|uniref:Transglycosylase-like protein with SLT domain n=2 Tax=Petrotoga sibirica TaxID=156202 RepID=A0A4R8EXK4_9BACT|nr:MULTISPECIES: transglycosylase SLT domain-containing protein [Petrotoga]POZ88847.1 lytic transglycosylase [Petrotoga sibirica DSM 13575]POZ90965.1 lytic transglycosylase [Petrotoga sp. SL27]TDX17470.1 transglycosylase-like protein with SLT domain [Petrotoga sibirica]